MEREPFTRGFLAQRGMGNAEAQPRYIVSNSGTVTSKARFLQVYGRERAEGSHQRQPCRRGQPRKLPRNARRVTLPVCTRSRRKDSYRLKESFPLFFARRVHVCCLSVFVGNDEFIAFLFITVLKCEPWGRRRWPRRSEHHLRLQRHSRRRRWTSRSLLATWSSRSRRLRRCRWTGRPRAAGS